MKTNNPFDLKVELYQKGPGRTPHGVIDAAVFVNDTLELCFASARQVFGEAATPELSLAIYDRLVMRLKSEQLAEPEDPAG